MIKWGLERGLNRCNFLAKALGSFKSKNWFAANFGFLAGQRMTSCSAYTTRF